MAAATRSRVYVVDGDSAVRDSMRSLIASLDVEVEVYANAEALLAGAELEPPACVVTEVHLPGMSGIELQERLRGAGVEVPVIVLASRGDVPTAVRALRCGAVDFIEKPFVAEVLVRRLRQVLNGQELERLSSRQPGSRREIFVARRVRQRLPLDDALFSPYGTLRLADPRAAHVVAHQLNRGGGAAAAPRPGLLNAVALEQEFFQRLLDGFRAERDPRVMDKAYSCLCRRFGRDAVSHALACFRDLFLSPPPPAAGADEAREERAPDRRPLVFSPAFLLEKLLLLWLANDNPAAGPLRELFDDSELEAEASYRRLIAGLEPFFDQQPRYGPADESLFALLRAPVQRAPDSITDQLQVLLDTERRLRGRFRDHLLLGLDLIKEEEKPAFSAFPAPPPAPPRPSALAAFAPRFTADRAWMAELVLVAKHVPVWLHQLSAAAGREIRRLDEIPGEALDGLAALGFNGLWLVGLWERSPASRRIKRQAGNPEAEASAYALSDYVVAAALGGEEALAVLERSAGERGIRLACDVVPNHMGLDSPWVVEHPDWFVSLPECPFPAYSFTGEDLSADPRVGLYLEDHYADRSDAAVVFLRVDRESGEERYVYHGNDGTSLPWNDTAQLDYLNPEVREAMIALLVRLARRFPILRIDAAMTLVKQHVQRLWYPPPGAGGDIPSRSRHGLSRDDFERRMPEEFWRQAVDRVAAEAPDALLLAEGFWLMEAYFVRSLGMHRVYHSAFMHQLRDEDNAAFRTLLRDTLAFDPGILERWVNFLTNPDEAPAAEQLGTGDKYFALATLLATLPGLPLFGHGQIEGLREKYGMEYARAYAGESADPEVVARHERQISPLLARRRLFAGCDAFRLYDVEAETAGAGREILDDVLAVSNAAGDERALVLVHNRDATVRATVRRAAPHRDPAGHLVTGETLGKALGLEPAPELFVRCRDQVSGLEYLLASRDLAERGLEVELGPYESRVLLDFRAVRDDGGRLRRLAGQLAGGGVPDLDDAIPP